MAETGSNRRKALGRLLDVLELTRHDRPEESEPLPEGSVRMRRRTGAVAAATVAVGIGAFIAARSTGRRTFTAISNIMKTKHDTVKNSISNVR
ncbi:MAG: hypothetical protein ACJ75Q_02670 [Gaiellaceae bacterium]